MKRQPPKYQREDLIPQEFLTFNQIELTKKQKQLVQLIEKSKITLVTGPAGTAKTFSLCYSALKQLRENKVKKIILCKPTVIVGGSPSLGHLPGEVADKIGVFAESFYQNFTEIVSTKDFKALQEEQTVTFIPAQYIRGYTFKNAIILIDEFQNFTLNELYTIVTRLGENSKMVFAGDCNQSDIGARFTAVNKFQELLSGLDGVAMFEFIKADIVRDPLLIEIIDRFEKMQAKN